MADVAEHNPKRGDAAESDSVADKVADAATDAAAGAGLVTPAHDVEGERPESPKPAKLESVESGDSPLRSGRRRLTMRGEFALALLPTVTVLAVFGLIEWLSHQRLLYASLASSAFLIYLDPGHGTNRVRTLAISQLMAAGLGFAAYELVPSVYASGGVAMVLTIVGMILLDVVHPPAVSTSLAFAFKSETASSLAIFGVAVGITATLVLLQRAVVWVLAREQRRDDERARRRDLRRVEAGPGGYWEREAEG